MTYAQVSHARTYCSFCSVFDGLAKLELELEASENVLKGKPVLLPLSVEFEQSSS